MSFESGAAAERACDGTPSASCARQDSAAPRIRYDKSKIRAEDCLGALAKLTMASAQAGVEEVFEVSIEPLELRPGESSHINLRWNLQ